MVELDYIVSSKRWNCFLNSINVDNYVNDIFINVIKTLNYKIPKTKTIELSVNFTSDNKIKKINNKFRNIDKSTNVLSFPFYEKEFCNALKYENYLNIGDIILSFETIEKESIEQNKSFKDHLTHLIVHSILHLFGFDHIEDNDADEMENLEITILSKQNINNPYI